MTGMGRERKLRLLRKNGAPSAVASESARILDEADQTRIRELRHELAQAQLERDKVLLPHESKIAEIQLRMRALSSELEKQYQLAGDERIGPDGKTIVKMRPGQ